MYKKYTVIASLTWVSIMLFLYNSFEVITIESIFAQVKGGLSASSVNPNSTIARERIGNTTTDLMTGGTSAASVTEGMTMTMSERTGNTTNISSTHGGLSASSVGKAGK